MKILFLIVSNNSEKVWNGFRLANNFLKNGYEVNVFLLGEGVESDEISNEKFDINFEIDAFLKNSATVSKIYACGTCLGIRNKETPYGWYKSTLDELRKLILESDKVITF